MSIEREQIGSRRDELIVIAEVGEAQKGHDIVLLPKPSMIGLLKLTVVSDDGKGNAVHKSHLNRQDKRDCIRALVEGEKGAKMCHVFSDGSGTTSEKDTPA